MRTILGLSAQSLDQSFAQENPRIALRKAKIDSGAESSDQSFAQDNPRIARIRALRITYIYI